MNQILDAFSIACPFSAKSNRGRSFMRNPLPHQYNIKSYRVFEA